MNRLKAGDRVQVLGEGPVMTVVELLHHDYVVCQWIDESGGVDHKSFPATDLRVAQEGTESETDEEEDEE
jgi:uncharacterized protein YodC (DUF2158 family)